MSNTQTPVLFLNFNRPDLTSMAIDYLRKVKPLRIYLAQDGPRKGKDEEKCKEVTSILRESIDWDCEKHYLIRDQNLGCKKAVSGAIDWFFKHEASGIILEDDCLLHPDFYRFAEELLEKYESDPKVAMITGFNPGAKPKSGSYFFSRWALTIGWATWRHKWNELDMEMSDFAEFKEKQLIRDLTKNQLANQYMLKKWNQTYENRNDSWAYRWSYHLFKNGLTCIVPAYNMLRNVGVNSEDATHTKVDNRGLDKLTINTMQWPLVHPTSVDNDELDMALFYKLHKSKTILIINDLLPESLLNLLRPLFVAFLKLINR